MEEGFDDFKMENIGEKYPEYKNMDFDNLQKQYDDLITERDPLINSDRFDYNRIDDVDKRLKAVENLRYQGLKEDQYLSTR